MNQSTTYETLKLPNIKKLTCQEVDELNLLDKESKEELKQRRRYMFMNCSPALREAIITDIETYELYTSMDSLLEDKSERQVELSNRKEVLFGLDLKNFRGSAFDIIHTSPNILNYFTKEEVIEMHKQATVEEMIRE